MTIYRLRRATNRRVSLILLANHAMPLSVDFDRPASSCIYAGPPGFDEYRVDVRLAVVASGHDQPPASLWFELDVPAHVPDHPTAYQVHVTVTPDANGIWKIQCDGWWADAFNGGTAKVFSAQGGTKCCEDTITPIRDEFGPRLVWGSSLTKPVEPKKPRRPVKPKKPVKPKPPKKPKKK